MLKLRVKPNKRIKSDLTHCPIFCLKENDAKKASNMLRSLCGRYKYMELSCMNFLKALLFYPLLWLRGLVLAIGRVLSGLLLLASLIIVIVKLNSDTNNISWLNALIPAITGFVIFMIMEFYDQILLKLNPTNNELTLYR